MKGWSVRAALAATAATIALLTANPSFAVTVDINSLLTNASFENGLTGWIVNPSGNPPTATSYTPLSTQYPTPNGLPSGFIPDGNRVAATPTDLLNNGSSVSLLQSLWNVGHTNTWQLNTTYTLNFYVGLPATCPTGSQSSCSAPDIVQLLIGQGTSNNVVQPGNLTISGSYTVDGGAATAFSALSINLPKPTAGDWEYIQASFVVTGGAGLDMGIGLRGTALAPTNNKEINWDVVSARSVPGPVVGAGLPGLVMAFGGFLAWRRRKALAA